MVMWCKYMHIWQLATLAKRHNQNRKKNEKQKQKQKRETVSCRLYVSELTENKTIVLSDNSGLGLHLANYTCDWNDIYRRQNVSPKFVSGLLNGININQFA